MLYLKNSSVCRSRFGGMKAGGSRGEMDEQEVDEERVSRGLSSCSAIE